MATTTKAPKVPAYQPLTLPAYQPIDYNSTAASMLPTLQNYAAANTQAQVGAQSALTQGAANASAAVAPQVAQTRADVSKAYSPQNVDNYLAMISQADPEFQNVRNKLGTQVSSDLDAGYGLSDALSNEISQDIRKGQTSRGNWLGPAATADEAFGKASARLSLYNQRQSNANAFLNGRATSDLFSAYAPLEGYQSPNVITPTGSLVDASIPASIAGANASNANAYNSSLISAYGANQAAQQQVYTNTWDRYVYDQAVKNGLYSPVSGGGGGIWGSSASSALTGAAGGALSGAAAGTAIMPGWGTAIGAVAGGIFGAVSGSASTGSEAGKAASSLYQSSIPVRRATAV